MAGRDKVVSAAAAISPSRKQALKTKQGSKKPKYNCPICEDGIDDSIHDSIFCEGVCQTWVHRGCGGLSKHAHAKAKSLPSWSCPVCRFAGLNEVIASLKGSIDSLTQRLQSLQDGIEDRISSAIEGHSNGTSSAPTSQSHLDAPPPQSPVSGRSVKRAPIIDRKYNIYISGVPEQAHGTPRRARTYADHQRVASIFQDMASDVSHNCIIRDCHRLGKYNRNSQSPRPLLVTMNSTADVSFVLRHCRSLPSTISVRPDLTPSQRKERSILLQERRKLLESDSSRRDLIKIRGSRLYVNGALSGSVVDNAYVPAEFAASNNSTISNGSTSDPDPPLSPHSNASPVTHSPSNIDSSPSASS